jgi:streptogramin lyase
VVTGLSNPNDAVVADDGSVYYSNQGDRLVYRVAASGGPAVAISKTPFGITSQQLPSAVTMDPGGNLIVGLDHGGPLYQVVLSGGLEAARAPVPGWTGWANGLTYDRRGRLYIGIYDEVASRDVVRLEADRTTTTIASGGRFSSLAFGRGPLDCRDLYVADPYAAMRRVHVGDAF